MTACVLGTGCTRVSLGPAPSGEDAALQGPRTLGFIEVRHAIPAPSMASGASLSPIESEAESDGGAPPALDGASVESASADAAALPEGGRAWVAQGLPTALARAIDARGHRMAIIGSAVVDESGGARRALSAGEGRCDVEHEWLSFDEAGAGFAVREGRVFVRRPGSEEWVAANGCTDVPGEPWVFSEEFGWKFVARNARQSLPATLSTLDRTGAAGWTVVNGIDSELDAVVLDPDGSRLVLEHGGHPFMVDNARAVAGAVFATTNARFTGVTRTKNGVLAWREEAESAVIEVLHARWGRGPFRRERLVREGGSRGARVLGVWTSALGQRVAVTARGVELFEAGAVHGTEVARWPLGLNSAHGINIGWLADGRLAVVTPVGWAHAR